MTYKVELIPTEEGYAVGCPDLPGCRSEGRTEEEAIGNIRNVISEYLGMLPQIQEPRMIRFVDVPDPAGKTRDRAGDRTPFVVKAWDMGLPREWTSHKIDDLLDILEGPDRR